jgi:hypothetical protein
MNLSDMLGYADIEQLTRIAGVYRCECNGHSKNELIQSILQAVGGREIFAAHIGEMPLEELRFMNFLLFDERNAFSLEDLTARVRQSQFDKIEVPVGAGQVKQEKQGEKRKKAGTPGKAAAGKKTTKSLPEPSPRDMIVRFKHYGWLFNGFSGHSRYLFQVPDDLKLRFREAMASKFKSGLEYSKEPAVYRDEQELLGEDVIRMLRYIRDQEIPLTTDGSMYKRQIQQLSELYAVQEELPQKGAWRFGYGRRFKDYPDRMALIYDYCHHKRWIAESNLRLTITQEGIDKIASGSSGETEALYRFWLRLYKNAIPNLPSLVHWVERLAEDWVTLASLRNELLPFVKSFYYDSAETVFGQRILIMMMHLGLIRIGEHETAGQIVRMTKLGHAIITGAAALPVS